MGVTVVFKVSPDNGAASPDDMDLIALADVREIIVKNPHLTLDQQIDHVANRWGLQRAIADKMVLAFYHGRHLWTM